MLEQIGDVKVLKYAFLLIMKSNFRGDMARLVGCAVISTSTRTALLEKTANGALMSWNY